MAYCDWKNLAADIPRAYDHGTWECSGGNVYSAEGFRLPTEAEWEYACRAGSTTAFANGEITNLHCEDPVLDLIGWYCGNSEAEIQPVAQLVANDWGLYDMHGNVYEWCNDWTDGSDYAGGLETDPVGGSGIHRVLRSAGVTYNARICRTAARASTTPEHLNKVGFRLVRSVH